MDWSNERYVRMYTRDTTDLVAIGPEGRAVWWELLRKVDRAGVLDHQGDLSFVPELLRVPIEWWEAALPRLQRRGLVEVTEQAVVIPNFLEAQEARISDRQRQAESRARRRARARSKGGDGGGGGGDGDTDVTDGHTVSHDDRVTSGHTESRDVHPVKNSTPVDNRTPVDNQAHKANGANPPDPHADVTDGHTVSRFVTPSLAVPSLAKPKKQQRQPRAPARVCARVDGESDFRADFERLWAHQERRRAEFPELDPRPAMPGDEVAVRQLLTGGWTVAQVEQALDALAQRAHADRSQLRWLNGSLNWRPDVLRRGLSDQANASVPNAPPKRSKGLTAGDIWARAKRLREAEQAQEQAGVSP